MYSSRQGTLFPSRGRDTTNAFRPAVLDLLSLPIWVDSDQDIEQPNPDRWTQQLQQYLSIHGPPRTVSLRDVTANPTVEDLMWDDEPAPGDDTTPAPDGGTPPVRRGPGRPKGVKNRLKYGENGNVIVKVKRPKEKKRKLEPELDGDGEEIVVEKKKRRSPGAKTKPPPPPSMTPPPTPGPSSQAATPATP